MPTEPTSTSAATTTDTGAEAASTSSSTPLDTGADTTTAVETATGWSPVCGNALQEDGEMCDLGWENNTDLGYCKTDCTLATCGDGDLWAGVEVCDEGPGGNNGEYGGCLADCSARAPFCGDGLLDPGEGCDNGEANGTPEHADGFAACSATCNFDAKRVLISSLEFNGKLGGLTGADLLCQNLVKAAGWPEWTRVRAWLSDGSTSALTRLTAFDSGEPYVLVNGRIVATNLTQLIAAGPGDGIDLDEHGTQWLDAYVWTNTAVTGEVFSATDHCYGWTSANPVHTALGGWNAVPKLPADEWTQWSDNKKWTSHIFLTCEMPYHLYCFEI